MIRIGIDARFLLRPLRGIPLYVTRLCQYLPALNRDCIYYLFINRGFEHNDNPENYQHTIDNILKAHDNVKIINYDHDAEFMWEQVYLPQLIKEHKINLLHMPANRICFCPGVPTIVTLHDVMEYLFLKKDYFDNIMAANKSLRMAFYEARMGSYIWACYKIGFKRAAKIVTVSHYSAGDIVKHLKIAPGKVTAIHHGLDDEFYIRLNERNAGTNSRDCVVMLGGDSFQKNSEGAIAAWAEVPRYIRNKYPLKVIGFCGSDQSPLTLALKKNKLEDEVEVKGWVTQKELIEYLQKAALFLYLSRNEGFGFPLLQAMASGTPVISTNRTSLPEVLGDVGFQFEPDDYSGIAGGIERILLDSSAWAEQSAAGIQRSHMFSWLKSAEEHLEVYTEVLRG